MSITNNPVYRVIIAGSRGFLDYDLLLQKCREILNDKLQTTDVVILSGGAQGADQLGERFAQEYNLTIETHKPDWASYRRGAGIIRNKEMADNADALIAFWNGTSKGTSQMIEYSKKRGLKVDVITF